MYITEIKKKANIKSSLAKLRWDEGDVRGHKQKGTTEGGRSRRKGQTWVGPTWWVGVFWSHITDGQTQTEEREMDERGRTQGHTGNKGSTITWPSRRDKSQNDKDERKRNTIQEEHDNNGQNNTQQTQNTQRNHRYTKTQNFTMNTQRKTERGWGRGNKSLVLRAFERRARIVGEVLCFQRKKSWNSKEMLMRQSWPPRETLSLKVRKVGKRGRVRGEVNWNLHGAKSVGRQAWKNKEIRKKKKL